MVDLHGHEAGNGGYSQRKPKAHRDSSTESRRAMVDLSGHEAGNGGYSQRKPTAHRVSSTRKVPLVAGAGSNRRRLLEPS